jgi:hypothetical protein
MVTAKRQQFLSENSEACYEEVPAFEAKGGTAGVPEKTRYQAFSIASH